MHKYAIAILSLALVSTIAYAISIETDPKAILEKENREKIINCLEDVYTKTGSDDMKKQIKFCESLPLFSISGTLATGSTVVPSGNRWEGLDDKNIVISDWLNSQEVEKLTRLQSEVCRVQPSSSLCTENFLLERLYIITESRLPGKNFFPILLGITNAESSLGLNFAKDRVGGTCAGRNNWGGIKWKINDDGSRQKDQSIPDQYGCYLYKFNSIEEYWISKVNTVRFGYKGCVDHATPIRCMSYAYVGDRNVAEESWIRNVSIFLQ